MLWPGMAARLAQLRALLRVLGEGGGRSSPSVYDTAQALRLVSTAPGHHAAAFVALRERRLDWLRAQQAEDGGFGAGPAPLARSVATLAAVLALHPDAPAGEPRDEAREGHSGSAVADRWQVERGLAYLQAQAQVAPAGGVLPSAAELILLDLLAAARRAELPVPQGPAYEALRSQGASRQAQVQRERPGLQGGRAVPLLHSFELWGARGGGDQAALRALCDASGGIGHSPAATCALLALSPQSADAWAYLARAGAAFDGALPTGYPLDRFEQSFALYALLINGLLREPPLAVVVAPQVASLARALTPQGLGCSDAFVTDVDDTAAALAVLAAWQGEGARALPREALRRFLRDDRFLTWEGESLCAPSANARAVHALRLLGEDQPAVRGFLRGLQRADGLWAGDKWHCSPLYVSLHVALALRPEDEADGAALAALAAGLLQAQRADGSFFSVDPAGVDVAAALPLETAFALTLLCHLARLPLLPGLPPRRRLLTAAQAALGALRPFCAEAPLAPLWLAKQVYAMPRVDGAFVLGALLGAEALLRAAERGQDQAQAAGASWA